MTHSYAPTQTQYSEPSTSWSSKVRIKEWSQGTISPGPTSYFPRGDLGGVFIRDMGPHVPTKLPGNPRKCWRNKWEHSKLNITNNLATPNCHHKTIAQSALYTYQDIKLEVQIIKASDLVPVRHNYNNIDTADKVIMNKKYDGSCNLHYHASPITCPYFDSYFYHCTRSKLF